MPSPTRHPVTGIFEYRVRVPADIAAKAKGREILVPVGDEARKVRVGSAVKVSLSTRDPVEAKRRFTEVSSAVHAAWHSMRHGPVTLNFMQRQALAGEIWQALVQDNEAEPGRPERWSDFAAMLRKHVEEPDAERRLAALDLLAGGVVDDVLARRSLAIVPDSRQALLADAGEVMAKAFRDLESMARRDYTSRSFPAWNGPDAPAKPDEPPLTFGDIIDAERKRRTAGKDSVGVREKTFTKYRRECATLAVHRDDEDVLTISTAEVNSWIAALQAEGKLGNRTIGHALTDARTVWRWGEKLFPERFAGRADPFAKAHRPDFASVPSENRTFTLAEARTLLLAARGETAAERRWLPWLCAYSGARINEVASLRKDDFFEVDGSTFYRITTAGGRTLKTKQSERRVPVHPDLVAEGLLAWIATRKAGRLFPVRSGQNIGDWLRDDLNLSRDNLAPNHAWRHLFADLATVGGMSSDARNYLTGRTTGHSSERYGRSEVMLPGLAREMAKVPTILTRGESAS